MSVIIFDKQHNFAVIANKNGKFEAFRTKGISD